MRELQFRKEMVSLNRMTILRTLASFNAELARRRPDAAHVTSLR